MYEKFDPDKSDILAQAIKFNGNISALAQHYKISRETIYEYIKRDTHGRGIIKLAREYNNEIDMDWAEHVNRYNMQNYKTNPTLAQRAAEKVIDKKGHTRGWGVPNEQIVPEQGNIEMSDILMKQQARIAELEAKLGMNASQQ